MCSVVEPSILIPSCFLVQLWPPSQPMTYFAFTSSMRPDFALLLWMSSCWSSGARLLRNNPLRPAADP
ncbi:hypothetical protein MPH_13577 [Macrophomina phaseolina MS6]|uniref:Uncharacterized protein n=1 Tax=Macrophomina phaseolina (strain MS6) TaxID=1126212 RepID=K2QHW9_MACPH|nr:hypothetical protein MPH_13577 [Macrophomina phaseolina MS6]